VERMSYHSEPVMNDCEPVVSDPGVKRMNAHEPVGAHTVELMDVHSELVDDCTDCTAELLGTRAVGPVGAHTLELVGARTVEVVSAHGIDHPRVCQA
jgi:hypothetical protein